MSELLENNNRLVSSLEDTRAAIEQSHQRITETEGVINSIRQVADSVRDEAEQMSDVIRSCDSEIDKVSGNIEESKDITNDEIITQITVYDIYYKEITYKKRRELIFLNKINSEEKENNCMSNFKKSNLEEIFTDNLEEYILKLETKIKKIEDLGIVIDILNINKIQEMNKIVYLIGRLMKKVLMKTPQSL